MTHALITVLLLAPILQVGSLEKVTSGSKSREYILYDSVGSSSSPKPLILAFHGFGQKAEDLEHDIKLNAFAKSEDFVVAYPKSLGRGWNAGACCGAEDDLKFIDDIVKDLAGRANIDPNKLFVVGMSNGDMFGFRLAAEWPDRVAAVAGVAGSMEAAPTKKTPVPIMHFHGTADLIVPFDGTASKLPGGFKPSHSTQATIAKWVAINECTPPVTTDLAPAPRAVTRTEYPAGPAGAEVILIKVDGGGHLWPGVKNPTVSAALLPLLGKTNHKIRATELIGEFFKAHR